MSSTRSTRLALALAVLTVWVGACGDDGERVATAEEATAGQAAVEEATAKEATVVAPPAQEPELVASSSTLVEVLGDGTLVVPTELAASLGRLEGTVVADGSSTVFPISEAIGRELESRAPGFQLQLGVSGTGGGFQKFCRGETQVSNASRPIKPGELAACGQHGVELVELPIAFDGLSVVVHPSNTWAQCMTVDELRRLWEPAAEGQVHRWSQVREGWPETSVTLYAPGHDSGTRDYFTKTVVGREQASRQDFVGSEDDYLIAQDVASDPTGLGFFGVAYYQEYRDSLAVVAIDPGSGCVEPSAQAIAEGRYRPLSRPMFLYVSLSALAKPAVRAYVVYTLANVARVAREVGYVPLPNRAYSLSRERLASRETGSVFEGGSEVDLSITELLRLSSKEPQGRGDQGSTP